MARLLILLARFESHLPARQRLGRLPSLLILTDDTRGYDIREQLSTWPRGAAFIERTFGNPVTPVPKADQKTTRLATCSIASARKAHLNGVHWPQKRLKYRHASKSKAMIETTSAHGGLAIAQAARLGMHAILVSTAFQSGSPSAKRPLGALRLAKLQRTFPNAPIYALGGINFKTAKQLTRTQVHGVALVSFGKTRKKTRNESLIRP